ncbi:MAG: DNA primase [Chloroflexota bacterium]|nr:DNA primase [Chloroflexota bacterium]
MTVIDDIKTRLDIVDVIGAQTPLQKSGKAFKANCPFHQEKTPSFFVFPDRQSWRCFGACATGGDVFSFVMKTRDIEFGEALRTLAEQTNITLPNQNDTSKNDLILSINESANSYFQQYLASSLGTSTRQYLEKRSINGVSLNKFELGLSPPDGESLKNHLLNQGFTVEDLVTAGVARIPETGPARDIFRNRLIIPIRNSKNELVGFGGRTLNDTGPKYLNSPKTAIFDKSRLLYGLYLAKEAAMDNGLVVVEGYMDTIMAHQNGFTNVVASMGTALTEPQVSEIRRLTKDVIMALDADSAGQQATLRSLESSWNIFQRMPRNRSQESMTYTEQSDLNLRVALLPEGQDPDQVIRESPEKWRECTEQSSTLFDYLVPALSSQIDIESPRGKAWVVQKLSGFITAIPEPIEQDHYVQILASSLSINEETLRASITRSSGQQQTKKANGPRENPFLTSPESTFNKQLHDPIEDYYLAWIIQEPKLTLECSEVLPEYFSRPENREIIVQIHKIGSKNYAESGATWLRESLQPELIVQLESLLGKSLPQLDRKNVILAINNTVLRLEERYLRELKAEEAIRFLEIGNEPLPANNADSTLSTNKKIRENELLRASLRQSIFKGK